MLLCLVSGLNDINTKTGKYTSIFFHAVKEWEIHMFSGDVKDSFFFLGMSCTVVSHHISTEWTSFFLGRT